MFSNLSESLNKLFHKLKGKAYISEADVNDTLREVRVVLFEADVALPVVKQCIDSIKQKAIGAELVKSVNPSQQIIKIVMDELEAILTFGNHELNLKSQPPAVIMMLGLQGSGKTTSSAKLAYMLKEKIKKKVLLISLDTYRPAAQEQLAMLAKQISVDCLDIIENQEPLKIVSRGLAKAKSEFYDVAIFDTAGRTHTDENMMQELREIKKICDPIESILVLDSLTGQDAVNIAKNFQDMIGITSVILTRLDGDARGGAALSMAGIAKAPIKYIGTGETVKDLEVFDPKRIASRILGMGDVVTLVEKASEVISKKEAKDVASKIKAGTFDLNDLAAQLRNIGKMGGLSKLAGFIPGISKIKEQMEGSSGATEQKVKTQIAIIESMTPKERKYPDLLNASRKKRIAAGSGTKVEEINRLLKQHATMLKMMKKFGGMSDKDMKQMQRMLNV